MLPDWQIFDLILSRENGYAETRFRRTLGAFKNQCDETGFMLNEDQFTHILHTLPILRQAEAQLINDFKRAAFWARIPAGRDVFVEGDEVDALALLVSGIVRVYKVGETGREITLYRFGLGESCILTANAILSRQSFSAIATVEQDAQAVMIPADTFRDWIRRYDLWRDFVFALLSQRMSTIIEIVDEVAFRRMDIRVATLILERSRIHNPITITHQEIAAELGSSREVISRILEDLASQGAIHGLRGSIEVLDFDLLKNQTALN